MAANNKFKKSFKYLGGIIFHGVEYLIRHSPPGFRLITFDRQAGLFQNFSRSQVMVIGRSVSFSDPARPLGGGVGRPKHPKISPPQIKKIVCVSEPQKHFGKKKCIGKKNRNIF